MNYSPFPFDFCAGDPQEQTIDLFPEERDGEVTKTHTHTHVVLLFSVNSLWVCINRVLLQVHDDGGFDVCLRSAFCDSVWSVSSPETQQSA